MIIESGKVYKIRARYVYAGKIFRDNYVYIALLTSTNENTIKATFLQDGFEPEEFLPLDFMNQWEILSTYKLPDPYEHISTEKH